MKVAIIGSGYVGLVTGAGLAACGNQVAWVDLDQKKIDLINRGISPIYEPGLSELLQECIQAKKAFATSNLLEAMDGADVSLIAVGTPSTSSGIDLSYISQAAKSIAQALHLAKKYHVVCIKSTVIPGTTSGFVKKILQENTELEFLKDYGLCMNPEFLAEGTAVNDFMNPDRIVIGASDERSANLIRKMYKAFDGVDTIVTSPSTAEMSKYASNSFLASVISYSNEISNICAEIEGVDAIDVMKIMELDRRISPFVGGSRVKPGLVNFLLPGTGYGGSCFPKDVSAITTYSRSLNLEVPLLSAINKVNEARHLVTIGLIESAIGSLSEKKILILGLAFKPNTDDIRESPAIKIIEKLLEKKAIVFAHDPVAIDNMRMLFGDDLVSYAKDINIKSLDVDAVVLVTSWPEYMKIPTMVNTLNVPLIDGRRFINKNDVNFYYGIGKNISQEIKP